MLALAPQGLPAITLGQSWKYGSWGIGLKQRCCADRWLRLAKRPRNDPTAWDHALVHLAPMRRQPVPSGRPFDKAIPVQTSNGSIYRKVAGAICWLIKGARDLRQREVGKAVGRIQLADRS